MKNTRGFTLMEVLIVAAIMSLILGAVMASLSQARLRARSAQSVSDIKSLQLALQLYHDYYGQYPTSGGNWDGLYTCWGDASADWIPGITPDFIRTLPRSPNNSTACDGNYIYNSNGTDYKLIWHLPLDCVRVVAKNPDFQDPARICWAYGVHTPGAAAW